MRKIIVIVFFVFIFFFIEFLIFNVCGPNFVPNLLLLLVIFFNLYLGIRYSLLAAIFAGILKDSFSTNMFGIHLVTFIACAYMTTFFKKYIYHMGSTAPRVILIFLVVVLNIMMNYLLRLVFISMDATEVLRYILLPELLMTLLVATFTFNQLKKCVSKLFA